MTCLSSWELTLKVQVPTSNGRLFVSTVCLKASLNLAHPKPNFVFPVFHPLLPTVERFQCFPKVHFCNSSTLVGQPSLVIQHPLTAFSPSGPLCFYTEFTWVPLCPGPLELSHSWSTSHPLSTFSSLLWYKGLSWGYRSRLKSFLIVCKALCSIPGTRKKPLFKFKLKIIKVKTSICEILFSSRVVMTNEAEHFQRINTLYMEEYCT